MAEEIKLRPKVVLRRKQEPVEFTFDGLLKVICTWNEGGVSSDLDLCMFYRTKDGQDGGVFSSGFRQRKDDLGHLDKFPYMEHKGDMRTDHSNPDAKEQVNVSNLNEIDTAYVCVLAYDAAIDGESIGFNGCNGRVELMTDSGDYLEVPIDTPNEGVVYHVCSIKNAGGKNSVFNVGDVLSLGEAYDKIPGFKLLVE
ncbi:MAG: hypothetical protein IJ764_02700 [Bacteroidales bacterium]|nr:hypothetical protein [Bacteroidales bacterium]